MVASTAEARWVMRRSLARFFRRATKKADPHGVASFERIYEKDGWAALRSVHEAPRYGVVAGYAHHLVAKSVLDLGCGEGLLLNYLPADVRYCGVDFSETAIAAAEAAFGSDRATFDVADAEQYTPRGEFDLIVLNEVLYSLVQPGRLIADCLKHLAPGGHIVVSCEVTPAKEKIWPIVAGYTRTVDTVWVRTKSKHDWSIRLLHPVSP